MVERGKTVMPSGELPHDDESPRDKVPSHKLPARFLEMAINHPPAPPESASGTVPGPEISAPYVEVDEQPPRENPQP